jgi:hypothetical protein
MIWNISKIFSCYSVTALVHGSVKIFNDVRILYLPRLLNKVIFSALGSITVKSTDYYVLSY